MWSHGNHPLPNTTSPKKRDLSNLLRAGGAQDSPGPDHPRARDEPWCTSVARTVLQRVANAGRDLFRNMGRRDAKQAGSRLFQAF